MQTHRQFRIKPTNVLYDNKNITCLCELVSVVDVVSGLIWYVSQYSISDIGEHHDHVTVCMLECFVCVVYIALFGAKQPKYIVPSAIQVFIIISLPDVTLSNCQRSIWIKFKWPILHTIFEVRATKIQGNGSYRIQMSIFYLFCFSSLAQAIVLYISSGPINIEMCRTLDGHTHAHSPAHTERNLLFVQCSLVSFVDGLFQNNIRIPMEYKAFNVTFNILFHFNGVHAFSYSITNKSILNGPRIYLLYIILFCLYVSVSIFVPVDRCSGVY